MAVLAWTVAVTTLFARIGLNLEGPLRQLDASTQHMALTVTWSNSTILAVEMAGVLVITLAGALAVLTHIRGRRAA